MYEFNYPISRILFFNNSIFIDCPEQLNFSCFYTIELENIGFYGTFPTLSLLR